MAKVLKAADVMTKDVVTVSPDVTVAEAVKLMREKKVSSLVVERRTHENAWGIMTRKDVVTKVIGMGKDPKEVKVEEIMTSPLIMVSPGLTLDNCAKLMAMGGIRRAPVFDGKDIVGILSNTDIFHTLKV